ncbi:hypothetical protein ACOMHN_043513 [Nucella lapillus]
MVSLKLLAVNCAVVISILELAQPSTASYSPFTKRNVFKPAARHSASLGFGPQVRRTFAAQRHGANLASYDPAVKVTKTYIKGYGTKVNRFVPAGAVTKEAALLKKLKKHAKAAVQNAKSYQHAGLSMGKHMALLSLTKHALGQHVAGQHALGYGLQGYGGFGIPGAGAFGLSGAAGGYGSHGVSGYGHGHSGLAGYGHGNLGLAGMGYGDYGVGGIGSALSLQQQAAAYGGHAVGGSLGADPYHGSAAAYDPSYSHYGF